MKKIKDSEVREAFANELPFENTSGTLVGIPDPQTIRVGELDETEISRLQIDIENNGIRFVVLSYSTPIAWHTKTGWTYLVRQDLSPLSQAHKRLLD